MREQVTREDIAELSVQDFVLGLLFEKPYAVFAHVYRGYGPEVRVCFHVSSQIPN